MSNPFYQSTVLKVRAFSAAILLAAVFGATVQAQNVSTLITTNDLFEPNSIALDLDGNVYITDASNDRIIKQVPNDGTITVLSGQTGVAGYADGDSSTALFSQPCGMVYSTTRNGMVVADQGNQVIRLITLDGTVTTLAGQAGVIGFANGTNGAAQFAFPAGLAVDSQDNIYVAEMGNNQIRKISTTGTNNVVTTITGIFTNYPSTNNPVANFKQPAALAIGDSGEIYVADKLHHTIAVMSPIITTNNPPLTNITANVPPLTNIVFSLITITPNNPPVTNISGTIPPVTNVYANTTNATLIFPPVTNVYVNTTNVYVNTTNSMTNIVTLVAGSTNFYNGTNDAPNGSPLTARFNLPSGLLWNGAASGLLVSDTGNDTVRRVYKGANGQWRVTTLAGLPGQSGLVDGAITVAKFSGPIGLAIDVLDNGFYVADRANSSLRLIQTSPPLPPIADPVLGFVTFTGNSGGAPLSVFNAASSAVFNNPAIIAVQTELGVFTYITAGPTPTNLLNDTIPTPNQIIGASVQRYAGDGFTVGQIGPSIISPSADLTIKAICEASGRRPSKVVSAHYQFKTGNPQVIGINAASLILSNQTFISQMFYTVNGSDPDTNSATQTGPITFGPFPSGYALSLIISNDVALKVQAFADGFAPSGIVSNNLYLSDFAPNRLTFGFASGECSSQFIAASGLTYYAPVTLTLLPGQKIYSLQFNIVQTNLTGPVAGTYNFMSMLEKPDPANSGAFITIPPAMFDHYNVVVTVSGGTFTTNYIPVFDTLKFTNTTENFLGLGWLESTLNSQTNLYITGAQDLITYSQAHDTIFPEANSKIIVGGYSMFIPTNAVNGQTYQITLGRPSATSDGISAPAFILAPHGMTPPNLLGPGTLNGIKTVTVGTISYLAGDVQPFRWFNPGDFGDGNLQNNDVEEIFEAAVYHYNSPPTNSAFFDAYDVSSGLTAALQNGSDKASIDAITNGDGFINVDDAFVTFRRSLDPSLNWYSHYWSNGNKYITLATNYTGYFAPASPSGSGNSAAKSTGPHSLVVSLNDSIQGGSGVTLQIPIQAQIVGDLPARVVMMGISVLPLDGSPAVTGPVTFTPVAQLGSPTMTVSKASNNYAACWLNASVSGVSGTNLLGTLTVTLPPNANANSAYAVHFDHFSASPNGIGLFPTTAQDSLITVGSRTNSSWNDGIPDVWRLRYFGTISNLLSAANLDADGDGVSNWAEFKAGTNPQDTNSVLRLNGNLPTAPNFTVQWPTVPNISYVVEGSTTLFATNWITLSNAIGDGTVQQYVEPHPTNRARFYRVRVQ